MLCVHNRVGTDPFQPRTPFHSLPLTVKEPLTQVHLHSPAREPHFSKTKLTTLLCSQARVEANPEDNGNQAIIPDGTPTPNGVRSNWDFILG